MSATRTGQCACDERAAAGRMTDERFNDLINGPLAHPMILFRLSRLTSALRTVVHAAGPTGERVLEEFCAALARKDGSNE